MDIRIHTVDVSHEADDVTKHENYLNSILPTIFSYPHIHTLVDNSSIYCSLRTVINIHLNIFA